MSTQFNMEKMLDKSLYDAYKANVDEVSDILSSILVFDIMLLCQYL